MTDHEACSLLPEPSRAEREWCLTRTTGRIAMSILDFCRQRLAANRPVFTLADLHDFVQARQPIAPGSAGRVLCRLRARGLVNYEVVSRHASLYQLLEMAA